MSLLKKKKDKSTFEYILINVLYYNTIYCTTILLHCCITAISSTVLHCTTVLLYCSITVMYCTVLLHIS